MAKNIIFLSAGASKAQGAPSQNELINTYFKKDKESQTEIYAGLKEFFLKFFGKERVKNGKKIVEFPPIDEFPTFEEVLAILDLAIRREEDFKEYSREKLKTLRRKFIFLIGDTLRDTLKQYKGKHIDWHEKLIKKVKNDLSDICFISLNYDMIIDNRIFKNTNEQINYGISFENYKFNEDRKDIGQGIEIFKLSPLMKSSVKLYKLHGSLGWLYCPPPCDLLYLTFTKMGVIKTYSGNLICPKCKSKLEPLIVPPTYFKDMENQFLKEIWEKAELELRNAERIFFCGYSFPDADLHIKYLFKRAELYKGETPEIYVINAPKKEDKDYHERIRQRYIRFFKNGENVKYLDLSFEDFCKKGITNIENVKNFISPRLLK